MCFDEPIHHTVEPSAPMKTPLPTTVFDRASLGNRRHNGWALAAAMPNVANGTVVERDEVYNECSMCEEPTTH